MHKRTYEISILLILVTIVTATDSLLANQPASAESIWDRSCRLAKAESESALHRAGHLPRGEFRRVIGFKKGEALGASEDWNRIREIIDQAGVQSQVAQQILTSAASFGNVELVARMLDYGVDANIENLDGVTPLFAAAGCGRYETIDILLSYGADPNTRTFNGTDAMTVAIFHGDPELAEQLLNGGYLPCGKRLSNGLTLHDVLGRNEIDATQYPWNNLTCTRSR